MKILVAVDGSDIAEKAFNCKLKLVESSYVFILIWVNYFYCLILK